MGSRDSTGHLRLRRSTGITIVGVNGRSEGSLLYSLLQVRCNEILHLLLQIFTFLFTQPHQVAKDRVKGCSQYALLVALQMLKSLVQACQQGFCQVCAVLERKRTMCRNHFLQLLLGHNNSQQQCANISLVLALQQIQCYGYRLGHFAVLLDVAHLSPCERYEVQLSHHRCQAVAEKGRQS